jgi:hypothetical protein
VHRRTTFTRWTALAASLATILVLAGSAPAFAGNTRLVTVGSAADGQLPSVTVSAGESVVFPLTVRNTGRQTLNNVLLVVGKDGLPGVVENDPSSSVVPQAPVDFPTNVSITDSGTGGTNSGTGQPICTSGLTLRCAIGTLAGRGSFAITVTISATQAAAAAVIPTKAVVTVAEIGNDQGSNTDTFAAEGSLNLLAFSCDSIAAYRANQSKVVSTCAVTDPRETNGQSATITLPAHANGIALNDALAGACPAQLTTCYSNATVEANIDLDTTGDTILWVVDVELAAGSNVNVLKIVVYHEDDDGNVTLIPLTKKNACKTVTQTNCGAAEIVQEGGLQILRVSFQTAGNGKGRF